MYSHEWDGSTGGYVLTPKPSTFSKEPRPVYYKELDILGFDKYWNYDKNDSFPYMWAEANNYYYRGRQVAKIKGGTLYTAPEITLLDDPEPDGFLLRFDDWCPEWLEYVKESEGISEITPDHQKVLDFLQDYYKKNGIAPMVRILSKNTGYKLKEVYELFPSGPGKGACKMAGLPKPTGCV